MCGGDEPDEDRRCNHRRSTAWIQLTSTEEIARSMQSSDKAFWIALESVVQLVLHWSVSSCLEVHKIIAREHYRRLDRHAGCTRSRRSKRCAQDDGVVLRKVDGEENVASTVTNHMDGKSGEIMA